VAREGQPTNDRDQHKYSTVYILYTRYPGVITVCI
jgi:hypothetical protein